MATIVRWPGQVSGRTRRRPGSTAALLPARPPRRCA